MMIIGVDYHPSFQAIAFYGRDQNVVPELNHSDGQAEIYQETAMNLRAVG
jgi:hypothetical protein